MAWASTVAVVVPSPATSEVLERPRHHLSAHVLERILQLDFLRYRYAVLGDDRAPNFFSMTAFRLGPQRDLHGVG